MINGGVTRRTSDAKLALELAELELAELELAELELAELELAELESAGPENHRGNSRY